MNPWEKYAAPSGGSSGPWDKYASPKTAPSAPETSFGEKALGVGEAALSAASAIPAGVVGTLYGVGKGITGGQYGTQAGVRQGEAAGANLAEKLTYQPRTTKGKEYLGAASEAFDASKLAGLPVEGQMAHQIPKVPAMLGKAADVAGEGAQVVKAGAGAVKNAAKEGAVKGVAGMLPVVEKQTAGLAKDAQKMGFQLRPDQMYSNKYGRNAGEIASQIPASGAVTEYNQNVFNRNVLKTIGGEGDKLTREAFVTAMQKSGSTIGDIAEKTPIPLSATFVTAMRNTAEEAAKFQSSETARAIKNYVDEIVNKSESGVIPGKTFRVLNSKIGAQMRATNDGDLKFALGELQDTLHDALSANLSKEDNASLLIARRHYAAGKALEGLVAKAPTGDIPPSALLGAVTATKAGKSLAARGAAGDLGKLADIGQRFLKEPASSGTAERGFIQKAMLGSAGLGGATMVTGPGALIGAGAIYGGANLYNRAGPSITRALLERPPK